ncbi:MAG: hypothetical protein SFX74_10700, partial [Fimbriimonadaceae bacterium]|nr:hypothetical protein [Fimbriimonadaceae bacterium]
AAVRQAKSDRFLRAMLAWAVVVFLFFTVSGAKLIHYIMPMFPPLAIVMASALRDRSWARPLAIGTCIAMTILTNLGFPAIAQQLGQTEAHALIRTVNGRPEPVALYQIGRRERDRGTGGTQLRETSLPSLRLYLDRDARDVESPAELARGPIPVLIFTRVGRLTQEDAAQFARKSLALRPLMKRNHFEVFQLEKTD